MDTVFYMEKKITALKPQKNHQDRINVYLDDTFGFGVSRYVAAGLKIGQYINQEQIDRISDSDIREKAYQTALRFIGYKPRTRQEVIKKLQASGYSELIIISVVDELEEKKYLNDQDYAQQWVETRVSSHPRSHRLLFYELKNKGMTDETIHEALQEAPSDYDLAVKLGKKNLEKFSNLNNEIFQKKMWGLLTRKAFGYEVIKQVIEQLLEIRTQNEME